MVSNDELEDELGAFLKHAGAPERRADGEAPLRGAEARLGLAHLEDPDRRVEALHRDREAGIRAGRPLPQRPRDEALEAFNRARRRRNEPRHFLGGQHREQRRRIRRRAAPGARRARR